MFLEKYPGSGENGGQELKVGVGLEVGSGWDVVQTGAGTTVGK